MNVCMVIKTNCSYITNANKTVGWLCKSTQGAQP